MFKKDLPKVLLFVTASVFLTSCGSVGGFNEMLGINNEGIDATGIETNDPLKKAKSGDLPVPEGAAINTVTSANGTSIPKIIAPKIVVPKIVVPKVVKATISKPKANPKTNKPIVKVKPVVTPVATKDPVIKTSPLAYKFVDLFTFRADMRGGKLLNPLATAATIAKNNSKLCKLEGLKFTCGEYFITIETAKANG